MRLLNVYSFSCGQLLHLLSASSRRLLLFFPAVLVLWLLYAQLRVGGLAAD